MGKLCLVSVDVRSAHNVGAFLRTADGFGAEVVLCGITPYPKTEHDKRLPHIADKVHSNIAKTSLGAEKNIKMRYFSEPIQALLKLKKEGYKLIAVEQDPSSIELRSYSFKKANNYALVLGAEVTGLPRDILNLCDDICEITMVGKKESFNVSVAACIALYQASNKLVVK